MDFSPISISSKSEIHSTVGPLTSFSDLNFASLYCWASPTRSEILTDYAIVDGGIVIRQTDYVDHTKSVWTIVGTKPTLLSLVDELRSNGVSRLELIPEPIAAELSGSYHVEEDRDQHDYVYDVAQFLALEGPAYRRVRRQLTYYRRDVDSELDLNRLEPSNDTAEFLVDSGHTWRRSGGRDHGGSTEEDAALRRAIAAADSLGLEIHAMNIGAELVSYCVVELDADRAMIHFDKSSTTVPGLSAKVKVTLFGYLTSRGIREVNYQQDLGIPGLREWKTQLNPSRMLKKYSIDLERGPSPI